MNTQYTFMLGKSERYHYFACQTDAMINTHLFELPQPRTYFHGPKGARAIEVLLYLPCMCCLLNHLSLSLQQVSFLESVAVKRVLYFFFVFLKISSPVFASSHNTTIFC